MDRLDVPPLQGDRREEEGDMLEEIVAYYESK